MTRSRSTTTWRWTFPFVNGSAALVCYYYWRCLDLYSRHVAFLVTWNTFSIRELQTYDTFSKVMGIQSKFCSCFWIKNSGKNFIIHFADDSPTLKVRCGESTYTNLNFFYFKIYIWDTQIPLNVSKNKISYSILI